MAKKKQAILHEAVSPSDPLKSYETVSPDGRVVHVCELDDGAIAIIFGKPIVYSKNGACETGLSRSLVTQDLVLTQVNISRDIACNLYALLELALAPPSAELDQGKPKD